MLLTVNASELPAPPEFVWPFYTEPAQWPRWTADIEHADIDGPLAVGATGRCKYRMLPEGTFTVVAFDPPHSFTLDWETLLTTVRFRHDLTPVGAHGTHVCERIDFHGLLALPLGLLERPRIRTHWPRAMDCLGTLALESYRELSRSHGRGLAIHRHPPAVNRQSSLSAAQPTTQAGEPGPGR
jgi:uncharacterized protein YndB with AHSA1/START domain